MAAEAAILVSIATSLASGLLKEASMKAIDAASESSTVAGLKSAIFGGFDAVDLRRLEKELSKLESVLCRSQSIDPMQRSNDNLVLNWLKQVKEAACFADNLLDEIAYERTRRKLQKETSAVAKLFARSDTSFCFRLRIAGKIKKFVSLAAEIYKEAETTLNLAKLAEKDSIATYQPTPTTTVSDNLREIRGNPDTSIVLGREADQELIVTKLCSSGTDRDLPVVAIVGRSGVGKTTLARMVYDNKTVREHFGKRTWIFVSDHFRLKRFLDEMLQSITGQSHNLSNISAMEDKLELCMQEEKKGHLLVLDDVWNTDRNLWQSVESSFVRISRFTRCRVLVTTQSFHVAGLMCDSSSTHELKDLGDSDAWELFKKTAFFNKSEEQSSDFEDVGRRILKKCTGLPLAIRTLGSLLRSMNEKSEWESVEKSEIWGLSLDQSNVMPWLLISFHHLPNAAMKQCFVHCSIAIEKGTSVLQSKLIQAWMAQGFIQSRTESDLSKEDIAETYVSNLVANGLLQVDIRPEYRFRWMDAWVAKYLWMHDLVHDLARFISKGSCWSIPREASDLQTASEAENLLIHGDGYSESKYNLPKGTTLNKLRTLLCSGATLSADFSTQAASLRDLRLINCGLKEVPSTIGRLKHLRYLSLCDNPFRYLPESVSTLFHLQTLDLEKCYKLDILPQGITKLVYLRHILTSKDIQLPKGMGQLKCLMTVPSIGLGVKDGIEIKELKSLDSLNDYIEITGLHLISRKEDVGESCILKTKARIRKLSLQWQPFELRVANQDHVSIDEEIMDGLHPHSNLKGIIVGGFGGKRLSSWLLGMYNLKTVELRSCNRCEQLPSLGQLGSLEEIYISGMECLERIGVEFYWSSHNNSDMSRRRILFPRLKFLCLGNMRKLRDWVEPPGSMYEVFPCLEKLEIMRCPLLVSAPNCFQSLLSFSIRGVKSGEAVITILSNTSELTNLDISGVDHLSSLSYLQSKCSSSLRMLHISDCKELGELTPISQSIEDLQVGNCEISRSNTNWKELCNLEIERCPNLSTMHGLESCVSMMSLTLRGNSKLELIPELRNLSRLTSLTIVDFSSQTSIPEWLSCLQSLRELEIGGFSEEVERLDGATHLPKCLKGLRLQGWPKLNCLPTDIQYLDQLESLTLYKFEGIERLPEWIGNLSSLQGLIIDSCHNLKDLPSLDAMQRLTQLRKLSMYHCPILKQRCNKDGGEEWDKISHLPYYYAS